MSWKILVCSLLLLLREDCLVSSDSASSDSNGNDIGINIGSCENGVSQSTCYYGLGVCVLYGGSSGSSSQQHRCMITRPCDSGSLPEVANGAVQIAEDESRATITCDEGYRLIGSDTVLCGGDGSWETTGSVCSKICDELPFALKGYYKLLDRTMTTVGAEARLHCMAGYATREPVTRECGSDGQWAFLEPWQGCYKSLEAGGLGMEYVVPMFDVNDPTSGSVNRLFLVGPYSASVSISSPFTNLQQAASVTPGQVTVVDIDHSFQLTQHGISNKVIKIMSNDNPFSVYVYQAADTPALEGSGQFKAFPKTTFGIHYWIDTSFDTKQVIIIGTEDETHVAVDYPPWVAQTNFEITLDQDQAFSLISSYPYSFAYMIIRTTKKVGVYVGGINLPIPGNSRQDLSIKQAPALESFRRTYIVSAFLPDYTLRFLIVARVPTKVEILDEYGNNIYNYIFTVYGTLRGRLYGWYAVSIVTDLPVLVTISSNEPYRDRNGIAGSAVPMPGIDQYLNEYRFNVVGNVNTRVKLFVPLIYETEILLDSTPFNAWNSLYIPVRGEGYYVVMWSYPLSAGYHHLNHLDPNVKFGAEMYTMSSSNAPLYALSLGRAYDVTAY